MIDVITVSGVLFTIGWVSVNIPQTVFDPPVLPPLSPVRDRLEKLELLTERERISTENTADPANTSAITLTVETPSTTLPQKIMKIKNEKCNLFSIISQLFSSCFSFQ